MDKNTSSRPRRAPAQTNPARRQAQAPRRTSASGYAPSVDRPSLSSRLNSLRLTYIRRVPLFYRRVIALSVLVLLVVALAAAILPRVLGRGADRRADVTTLALNSGTSAPAATIAPVTTPAPEPVAVVEEKEEAPAAVSASAVESAEGSATSAPVSGGSAVAAATRAPGVTGWQSGIYAPQPQGEGYLPVFMEAKRDDKVIAITVDDCYQSENLRQIIKLAVDAGGKLTIFPIGEMIKRESVQKLLKQAHELGFEIENHTWSHAGLYHNTDAELAKEIFNQDRAVDWLLGVNYSSHFLRPRGGDDRNDLRTHAYINQLGYYGIAHWSVCGTLSKISTVKKSLAPGQVYLFHCIDSDLALLKEFIPYAVSQGYQLVTMNELFGYEDNAVAPLTDDPKARVVPPLEPYERDYTRKLKSPTYEYIAYEVQVKLIELGLMEGKPDGIYGPGTAASAAKWQQSKGYTADGVLTGAQLKELLET